MKTYFMMGDYGKINRYTQLVFMNIPFIFELRVIIDWTYTRTALDVFQWIKLAKIQADVYYSKSLNISYF